MAKIEKKIWAEYFDAVASGKKRYELRLNDFDVQEGDILVLREWDKVKKEYTGRILEKTVSYVGRFLWEDLQKFWPEKDIKEKGIQIISI